MSLDESLGNEKTARPSLTTVQWARETKEAIARVRSLMSLSEVESESRQAFLSYLLGMEAILDYLNRP